eukprot:6183248-Pleurochrysis_carterae.AAC.3
MDMTGTVLRVRWQRAAGARASTGGRCAKALQGKESGCAWQRQSAALLGLEFWSDRVREEHAQMRRKRLARWEPAE